MEILQVPEQKRIIQIMEYPGHTWREIYVDGRPHPPREYLEDFNSFMGHSVGRWEGDTLVVDTVALKDNSYIEGFTPHSDRMTIKERIRFLPNGLLEDRITVTDPKALVEPWETVKTYRRAEKGDDQLREFACAEGLEHAK